LKPAVRTGRTAGFHTTVGRLDRVADVAKDLADLPAKEDERDDRDDRDEGEDQRVLGETLAFLVTMKRSDKSVQKRHVVRYLLSSKSPRTGAGGPDTERCRGRVGRMTAPEFPGAFAAAPH
jgi:hypothetical protein